MSSYYETCAFPKPGVKKPAKKKVNGYKNKRDRYCFYCGTNCAERHEIFGGANRQISIDNGFQVDLCPECHRQFHEHTEWGDEQAMHWKKHYQKQYEDKLISMGLEKGNARTMWMNLIGRNYL